MKQLSATTNSTAVPCTAKQVMDAVPPVIWFIRAEMRRHRGGLSMSQFRTLVRVNHEPAPNLSALAEHLGASMPTTSRIVAGLVDKGLIARRDSTTDRRNVTLRITARGRGVLDAAWGGTRKSVAGQLASATESERAVIREAMQVFKRLFGSLGLPADIDEAVDETLPAAETAHEPCDSPEVVSRG